MVCAAPSEANVQESLRGGFDERECVSRDGGSGGVVDGLVLAFDQDRRCAERPGDFLGNAAGIGCALDRENRFRGDLACRGR